jgi:hypothetical protein
MRKLVLMSAIFLIGFWLPEFHAISTDLEWTIKKQLDLKAPTLDVAQSMDGEWLFILTPGEVLVYSTPEDRVMNRIPLEKVFDRLIHFAWNNTLVLTSGSENTVKIIQLEEIHRFDMSGLPFEGPQGAPVTLVVFSDYQ